MLSRGVVSYAAAAPPFPLAAPRSFLGGFPQVIHRFSTDFDFYSGMGKCKRGASLQGRAAELSTESADAYY